MQTPIKSIGEGATSVICPDGTEVGSIKWGSLLEYMMVTLHGETGQGSRVLKTVSDGLFKENKRVWVDDWGNEFYWKTNSCHNAEDQIIARYIRGRKYTFRMNEPAWLSADSNYLPLFDHILFTAIMIEHEVRADKD
ncbi:hypothetical protein FRB95_012163 [Tulasnella sp. JGI-2019a]|nr:hypothetical protein FRB95_012163 [Tulasnella sp. JGI-2019a]